MRLVVAAVICAIGGTAWGEGSVKRDVRYRTVEGVEARHTSLDIHRPGVAGPSPVLVYVHGGGWRRGDKSAVHGKAEYFTSHGWVFVSVNYRLLPAGRHPANVEDVAFALAWVQEHIEAHGGSRSEIFLLGHSAGAHLAALVATDDRHLRKAGADLSLLQGCIPLDTNALDLPRHMEGLGRRPSLYREVFGEDPAAWKDASPFHFIAPEKHVPPFLLVVAANNASKLAQARAMAEALGEAGVRAEMHRAPERTHGTLNRLLGTDGDATTQAVARFLDSLRKAGPDDPFALGGSGEESSGPARHERAAQALLDRRDSDGDGRLTPEELPARLRGAFATVDANGDGALDRGEIEAALARWLGR